MSNHILVSKDVFKKYWNKYKDFFKLPESKHAEKYKWSVLRQVYNNWDWNRNDKAEMFKNAFEVNGPKNLWESGNFYAIGHSKWMFEKFEDETINAFESLFDESTPLVNRIKQFIDFYNSKLPVLNDLIPDKKISNHYHGDLRAIALYLTLQYPEKYFLFKYGMVKAFCQKFELPKIKAGKKENLDSYKNIAEQILSYIEEDIEFISEYRNFTNESYNFNDDSLHLLTQDFIYTVANHLKDNKENENIPAYYCVGFHFYGNKTPNQLSKFIDNNEWQNGYDDKFQNVVNSVPIGSLLAAKTSYTMNEDEKTIFVLEVHCIGKVIGNPKDGKNLKVEWQKDFEPFILKRKGGYRSTISKVQNQSNIKAIFYNSDFTEEVIEDEEKEKLLFPLNQILYGPPGTGKTYKTKKIAVEIIESIQYSDSIEDREIILEKYDEYVKSNQIHFTTFHQSMSYEDFIEGIKPKMNDDEEGELSYEIQDGIFKTICDKAKKSKNTLEKGTGSIIEIEPFDIAWNNLVESITEQLANSSTPQFNTLTNKKINAVGITDKGNLLIKPSGGSELDYIVSYNRTKKLFNAFPNLASVKNIDKEFRAVIGGSNSTAYWSILNYLHSWISNNEDEVIANGLDELNDEKQNSVLIIDEINRGNVSAIFGELITLIEKDKRTGEKESIQVTLPYSKTSFSVPNNLYIIGTMNTADRSVEALDTALRRRFSFEEVLPKPSLLNDNNYKEVDLATLVKTINKRVELLIDKDHQIGHSYFINIDSLDSLKTVFKDNIIPLLEEYFYGDFGKIGLVLGEAFVESTKTENKAILAKFKDYEDLDFVEDKLMFKLKNIDNMNASDFVSIYQHAE